MLASDVIQAALEALNEVAPGETINSDDLARGFTQLNALLDSWSTTRLNVFVITSNLYALTPAAGLYTLGPGGTLGVVRPVAIKAAVYQTPGIPSFQFPMHLASAEEYSKITDINRIANIVELLWYDDEYPTGALKIWPTPNTIGGSQGYITLWTWEKLPQLLATNSNFDMAPGYLLALQLNLAILLAPWYGRTASPELAMNAMQALAAIRGTNAPPYPGAAQEGQAEGAGQPVAGIQNNAKP